MKMKNVLITNYFFEKYTGSELHVLEVARFFTSKGYNTTIVCQRKESLYLGKRTI